MKDVFEDIYKTNFWRNSESLSGHGSTLDATKYVRALIPEICYEYELKTMLDIPCGDFNWMKEVDLGDIQYIGADIVSELVESNAGKYGNHKIGFRRLDITKDTLPQADVILVRDLLGHFSRRDVKAAISNMKASGSKYLLATTFPDRENNGDIKTGEWRPINLASMFGLGDPVSIWVEGCRTPGFEDKSLGLWRLDNE